MDEIKQLPKLIPIELVSKYDNGDEIYDVVLGKKTYRIWNKDDNTPLSSNKLIICLGKKKDSNAVVELLEILKSKNIPYNLSFNFTNYFFKIDKIYFKVINNLDEIFSTDWWKEHLELESPLDLSNIQQRILNNPSVDEMYKVMAKEDIKAMLKFIAQQALGLDSSGQKVSIGTGQVEQAEILFGRKVVDKAIELYKSNQLDEIKQIQYNHQTAIDLFKKLTDNNDWGKYYDYLIDNFGYEYYGDIYKGDATSEEIINAIPKNVIKDFIIGLLKLSKGELKEIKQLRNYNFKITKEGYDILDYYAGTDYNWDKLRIEYGEDTADYITSLFDIVFEGGNIVGEKDTVNTKDFIEKVTVLRSEGGYDMNVSATELAENFLEFWKEKGWITTEVNEIKQLQGGQGLPGFEIKEIDGFKYPYFTLITPQSIKDNPKLIRQIIIKLRDLNKDQLSGNLYRNNKFWNNRIAQLKRLLNEDVFSWRWEDIFDMIITHIKVEGGYFLRKMIKTAIQQRGQNPEQPLDEEKTKNQRKQLINKFVTYCIKYLKLKKPYPRLKLTSDKSQTKTYGHFDPQLNTIIVYAGQRSLGDILRTIGHEFIHRKQEQDNKLEPNSGETGSPIENEANAVAGILLRNFGEKFPMIFEIKQTGGKLKVYHNSKSDNYFDYFTFIMDGDKKIKINIFSRDKQKFVIHLYYPKIISYLKQINIPFTMLDDGYLVIEKPFINIVDEPLDEIKQTGKDDKQFLNFLQNIEWVDEFIYVMVNTYHWSDNYDGVYDTFSEEPYNLDDNTIEKLINHFEEKGIHDNTEPDNDWIEHDNDIDEIKQLPKRWTAKEFWDRYVIVMREAIKLNDYDKLHMLDGLRDGMKTVAMKNVSSGRSKQINQYIFLFTINLLEKSDQLVQFQVKLQNIINGKINEIKQLPKQFPCNREEFNKLLKQLSDTFGDRIINIHWTKSGWGPNPQRFFYGSLFNDAVSFSFFLDKLTQEDKQLIEKIIGQWCDSHGFYKGEGWWDVNTYPDMESNEPNVRIGIYKNNVSTHGGQIEEIKQLSNIIPEEVINLFDKKISIDSKVRNKVINVYFKYSEFGNQDLDISQYEHIIESFPKNKLSQFYLELKQLSSTDENLTEKLTKAILEPFEEISQTGKKLDVEYENNDNGRYYFTIPDLNNSFLGCWLNEDTTHLIISSERNYMKEIEKFLTSRNIPFNLNNHGCFVINSQFLNIHGLDKLQEIKQLPKVTPDMVIKLWHDLTTIAYTADAETAHKVANQLNVIWKKYINEQEHDLYAKIRNLDQNKLIELYTELLQIKKRNGINEIKQLPKVIPELIEKLWDEKDNLSKNNEEIMNKMTDLWWKYIYQGRTGGGDNFLQRVQNLSPKRLQEFYIELTNIKNG